MDKRELTTVLIEILEDNYLISPNKLKEENWSTPLTGKHFGLTGFEFANLILEFEKRTGVNIDINQKSMYALANIEEIVKSAS